MAFVIRRFQPEDTAQVQAIFAAGMRWYPEHQPGQPLNPFIEGYIAAAIADDLDPAAGMQATFIDGKGCFFVAVDQRAGTPTSGEVIGTVGGQALPADPFRTWDGPVIELRRMSVHANARGLGVATQLTAALEAHAWVAGIGRVVLSTGSVMAPAQRLYERCGYDKKRYVPFDDPENGITKAHKVGYVVYSKVLGAEGQHAQL